MAPTHQKISHTKGHNMTRLHTHEMEIGVTEAAQRHAARHVIRPQPVSQRRLNYEHARPRWLREMMAEATGVFFYVYPGIASEASFFLNQTEPAFGSIFQIGLAYAMGIAFAIIVCAPTSGGHFNPAVTICFALWKNFPWRKVPAYIFAQILGSFVAGLVLVGQFHQQMSALAAGLAAKGISANSLGGPGSILCSFPAPTETNYGYLFFNEWFVDSFVGIVIWAVLDPVNPFVSPVSAPFVIGLAYAAIVWGFAFATISANLARDLGTRIVAAIFYGSDAFNKYAVIAILVNIPATVLATAYYELLMRDSIKAIAGGHSEHEEGEEGLKIHLNRVGTLEGGSFADSVILGKEYRSSSASNYGSGYTNKGKETTAV